MGGMTACTRNCREEFSRRREGSSSAVVTGGASGRGKATVTARREQGVKVAIFDVNTENGERVAKELGAT